MAATSVLIINLNVSDTVHNYYGSARFHSAVHPEESPFFTAARALALAHNLSFAPKVGAGFFDHRDPHIYSVNTTEDYLLWVHVGDIDKKQYKSIHHLQDVTEVRFYFYEPEQLDRFCHLMRGSKENWIKKYSFYLFSSQLIEQLAASDTISRRIDWNVSFVEDEIYVSSAKLTAERGLVSGIGHEQKSQEELIASGIIQKVEIWDWYQKTLLEAHDQPLL